MSKLGNTSQKLFSRSLKRDGQFNVVTLTRLRHPMKDLYHKLLSTGWPLFLTLVGIGYILVNLIFGAAYYISGSDALDGVPAHQGWDHFVDCFFFSVQTLATIGYGKVSPNSIVAHLLVTVEALLGLLSIAIVTGLMFARFARPTARVLFSEKALVTPHEGIKSFMFRMANERMNQIVEAKVNVVLARTTVTKEGQSFRKFIPMKLLREQSPLFAISWTVIHPIDDASPLKELTREILAKEQVEIFVTVSGIDDTYAQLIHSRFSYTVDDILFDHRFEDILIRSEDGGPTVVDLSKFHQTRPVQA